MTNRLAFGFIAPLAFTVALAGCGAEEGISSLPVEEIADGKADGASAARFETFTGHDGRSYFHLLAANGQKVLQSQGYASHAGVQTGIASVRANGAESESYDLLQAQDGEWYFNLVAANGQAVATSELYVSRSNAERAVSTSIGLVSSVAVSAAATVARFQVFHGLDGQSYFHLRAGNGEIVLQSQGYSRHASAVAGIASVRANGADANRYQLKNAADGQVYFVLTATNGEIIGVSETYPSAADAASGLVTVSGLLASAAAP